MEDRTARLEAAVTLLTAQVADLDARLAKLERPGSVGAPHLPGSEDLDALQRVELPRVLALLGRTLLVLGGAYLLRALTGAGVLPMHVGVGLGLVYGAPWLVLAARAGGRGANLDALAHGIATALIGYPLVWEATVRFAALTPVQSALLLGVLTGAALILASARRLESLAWIVTSGALASAFTLAVATGAWVSYTVLAAGVGVATLWLGYLYDWIFLRWPAALVANLMILAATGRAGDAAGPVLVLQFLTLVAYLGSFAIRTLAVGREVIPFEAAQSVGVLVCAYGGALLILGSRGRSLAAIGAASLLLGAIGYALAFAWVDRHRHAKNFLYFAALALVFTMAGAAEWFGAAGAPIAYALAAMAAAALGRRYHRLTLALHAAVLASAAAVTSDLLTIATLAMATPASAGWAVPPPAALLALVAVLASVALRVVRPVESWGPFASMLRLALVILLVWTAAGTAVTVLASLVMTRSDPALLSTLRTAVLVVTALVVARVGGTPAGREAGWLMYPILAVTGIKLLVADIPQGRPSTLFAALALYGIALIAGPRVARMRHAAEERISASV